MAIVLDLGEADALTASERVAAAIRAVLGYRGLKQRDLARALGKNDVWVSVRLRGQQEIGVNDLEEIAGFLDVEMADLLPRKRSTLTRGEPHQPGWPPMVKKRPVGHRPFRRAHRNFSATTRTVVAA